MQAMNNPYRPEGKYKAVLGLGSNTCGCRATNLMGALNMIGRHIGRVAEVSNFYETRPFGPNSGNVPYINAVAVIETDLDKDQIETLIKKIENDAGRDRNDPDHRITIDIDLVVWNGVILRPQEIDREYFSRGWKEVGKYV